MKPEIKRKWPMPFFQWMKEVGIYLIIMFGFVAFVFLIVLSAQ